jgi:hypothetical protein
MKTLSLVTAALLIGMLCHAEETAKRLSLDLEKTGNKTTFILRWSGTRKSNPPIGHLYLERARKVPVTVIDSFDLGYIPSPETITLELPKRNVLLVIARGTNPTAGQVFHAFSSSGGLLYRVQLIDGETSEPLVFAEHYSAGSPSLIKFMDSGRTVRTLTTVDPETLTRRITDYSWDGVGYRRSTSFECVGDKCPAMKD